MKTQKWHNPEKDRTNTIPAGWRLLKVGEIPRHGTRTGLLVDGRWCLECKWDKKDNITYLDQWSVLVPKSESDNLHPKLLVTQCKWITDRRPTKEDLDCLGQVWGWSPSQKRAILVDEGNAKNSTYPWTPTGLKRPDAPKEKTQEELDIESFEKWKTTGLGIMENIWFAAIKYARILVNEK